MELAIFAVIALIVAVVIGLVQSGKEAERKANEERWLSACEDPEVKSEVKRLTEAALTPIDVPINLQRGEICFHVILVEHRELRTVTKRVNYAGVSTSFKVAKGVYIRSGSYVPQRVTNEEMVYLDSGILYFTNKRLIFDGTKKNMTLTKKTILSIDPMRDAIEVQKSSGRNPFFINPDYKEAIFMNAAAIRFMYGEAD
jgi:hypothetical protein